jgi:hypothetical protein
MFTSTIKRESIDDDDEKYNNMKFRKPIAKGGPKPKTPLAMVVAEF